MVLAGKRAATPEQLVGMLSLIQDIRAERDRAFEEALSGLVTHTA